MARNDVVRSSRNNKARERVCILSVSRKETDLYQGGLFLEATQQGRGMNAEDFCGLRLFVASRREDFANVILLQLAQADEKVAARFSVIRWDV